MRLITIAILGIASVAAAKDKPTPTRIKVRPITGELVKTESPCGAEVQNLVWKYVFRKPYIEIDGDTMIAEVGAMNARRAADRTVPGEPFVGFFETGNPKRTVAITVRRADVRKGMMPMYLAVIERNETRICSEKWLGGAEVL